MVAGMQRARKFPRNLKSYSRLWLIWREASALLVSEHEECHHFVSSASSIIYIQSLVPYDGRPVNNRQCSQFCTTNDKPRPALTFVFHCGLWIKKKKKRKTKWREKGNNKSNSKAFLHRWMNGIFDIKINVSPKRRFLSSSSVSPTPTATYSRRDI